MIFAGVANSTTKPARLNVYTDGRVVLGAALPQSEASYLSLASIRFAAAPVSWQSLTLQAGWAVYNEGFYGPARVGVDGSGRVHVQAMLTPGTLTAGTVFATLPSSMMSDTNQRFAAMNGDTTVTGAPFKNGITTSATTTYAGWWSGQAIFFPSAKSQGWTNVTLQNGWTRYSTQVPTLQFQKGRDGLVTLRGQVSGGAQGSYLGTLPVGARPATRQVFVTVATDGYGQVDVLPTGEIYARAVSGS